MANSNITNFMQWSPTENTSKALEEYVQYKIGKYIWIYISPILIIIGTFGNCLSIVVLLRKSMRASTTMFYLAVLSFGDLFTLYTGLLRYWIRSLPGETDIRRLTDAGCKIHAFLVYFSLDVTVWILVAVTLDRCLSVSLPFKAKRICSIRMSRIVVIFILVLSCLKNMHFFWTVELVHTWEFRCDAPTPESDDFLNFVWPWIDFSTFCAIPFTIMILCNIKIIYEMVISHRKIAVNLVDRNSSNHSNHLRPISTQGPSVISDAPKQNGSFRHRTITSTSSDTQQKIQTRRISSLTAMLLTVNCVFLITTFPIQLFLILEESLFPTDNRTDEQTAAHNLWWAVVNMLQYSNNSIHFFLYCLTGPRFRQELKKLFKRNNQISGTFEPSVHTAENNDKM